jgi:hypothetical protein
MPVPLVRTGSARLRPTRPQAVEGAAEHSPSVPLPFSHLEDVQYLLSRSSAPTRHQRRLWTLAIG